MSASLPKREPSPKSPEPPEWEQTYPFPYEEGRAFAAATHKPPAPLGGLHSNRPREPPPVWDWESLSQPEYCLKNDTPSTDSLTVMRITNRGTIKDDTPTSDSDDTDSASGTPSIDFDDVVCEALTVKIERKISRTHWHSAQVVAVSVTYPNKVTRQMIAKIFDPFYYRRDLFGNPINAAKEEFSREAGSYQKLRGHWGTLVPYYYGAWLLDVPLEMGQGALSRQVRMILLEKVEGVCLSDLNPEAPKLSVEERCEVMLRVIQTYSTIDWAGVAQHDCAPRNFMLRKIIVPNDIQTSATARSYLRGQICNACLQVALLDFGQATIYDQTDMKPDRAKRKRPRSPLLDWDGDTNFEEPGRMWLLEKGSRRMAWLEKHFSNPSIYNLEF